MSSNTPVVGQLPDEVLDTVTANNQQQTGLCVPTMAVWQPTTIINVNATTGKTTTAAGVTNTTQYTAGAVPFQVYNVSASEQPYKSNDGTLQCLVSVDWDVVSTDVNYNSVQIWVTGYHGSSTPALVASGNTAPVTFLLQTTGDNVTFTVVAVGASGATAPFRTAPTCTLTLNGQTTAPPYPSQASPVTALINNFGWQFAFNNLTGIAGTIIDGYWIYHSTSNSFPGIGGRYQYIKHSACNSGTVTVTEITSASPMYYWITSVNTNGIESTPNEISETTPSITSWYPTVLNNTGTGSFPWDGVHFSSGTTSNGFGAANPLWNANQNGGNIEVQGGFSIANQQCGCTWSFPSWSGNTPVAITLEVQGSATWYGSGLIASCELWFSTNGGSNWSNLYNWTTTQAQQWVSTGSGVIPNTATIGSIQVMLFVYTSSPLPSSGSDFCSYTVNNIFLQIEHY